MDNLVHSAWSTRPEAEQQLQTLRSKGYKQEISIETIKGTIPKSGEYYR